MTSQMYDYVGMTKCTGEERRKMKKKELVGKDATAVEAHIGASW